MTITTQVRIMWPVPAVALLDHVTVVAGGDPATVRRHSSRPGRVSNAAAQGLMTLADVEWSEQPSTTYDFDPDDDLRSARPPALVILSVDNPYGSGSTGTTGRSIQAGVILPAVVDWLDQQGVPRTAWWWEDETAGTFHPGTEDVAKLDQPGPRDTWQPATGSVAGG